MVRPILWKEWREQRWKLAFGTVMLIFFAGSFLAARTGSPAEVAIGVWFFGGVLLAIYSAMGVFAPERSEGTAIFLASRPVPAWQVFLVKWLMGWLNVVVPVAACTVLVVMMGLREIGTGGSRAHAAWAAVAAMGLATSIYTLTCCLAPRRAGEAYVGLFGLLVLLAIVIHLMVMQVPMQSTYHQPPSYRTSLLLQVLLDVNPIAWLALLNEPARGWSRSLMVVVQAAVVAGAMVIGWRKWRRGA